MPVSSDEASNSALAVPLLWILANGSPNVSVFATPDVVSKSSKEPRSSFCCPSAPAERSELGGNTTWKDISTSIDPSLPLDFSEQGN